MNREPIAVSLQRERDEYLKMQLSIQLFQPSEVVKTAILEAYHDPNWPWQKSDGCTGVSEIYFPKGFKFPPCVMHDHKCHLASLAKTRKERNVLRLEGDNLLYLANRDYGVSRIRSKARWLGVRIYWNFWGRWKSLKSGVHSGRDCCRGL